MAKNDLDITIGADTADLIAKLKAIPGVTEAETKRVSSALARGLKGVSKDAEKAAKEAAKEWNDKLGSIQRGSEKVFGGVIGDVLDVGAGLGALGPAGAVAAGGVLAVGIAAVGAAAAIVGITKAGGEAINRLAELEDFGLDPLDPKAVDSIKDANAALGALGVVTDQFIAALASELAPTVIRVATGLADLSFKALDTFQAFSDGHSVIKEFAVYMGSSLVQAILAPVSVLMNLAEGMGYLGEMAGLQDNALSRLGQSYDDWTYSIAASLIGLDDEAVALDELDPRVRKALEAMRASTDAKNGGAEAAKELAKAEADLASIYETLRGKGVAAFSDTDGALEKFGESIRNTNHEMDAQIAKVGEVGKVGVDTAQALSKAESTRAQMIERVGRDALKAIDAEHDAKIAAIQDDLKLGKISGEDALTRAETSRDVQIAAIDAVSARLQEYGIETSAIEMGRVAAVTDAEAQIAAIKTQAHDIDLERAQATVAVIGQIGSMATDSINAIADRQTEIHEERLDEIRENRKAEVALWQTKIDKAMEGYDDMSKADRAAIDAEVAGYRERIAATNEAAGEKAAIEKEALLKSFRAKKATALVDAAIASAFNALSLVPSFAYLGPGAPFAAAGVAAAAFSVQAGLIASQKAPSFHGGRDGLAPDETMARLTSQEAVLTPRAVQAVGGPSQVKAMNQGTAGSAGAPTLLVGWRGRVMDRMMADVLDSGGKASRRIGSRNSALVTAYR